MASARRRRVYRRYWSFLGYIARVEWGYVRKGRESGGAETSVEKRGWTTTQEEGGESAEGFNDMVGNTQSGGALGRCIVGVLAFNLTAQFH